MWQGQSPHVTSTVITNQPGVLLNGPPAVVTTTPTVVNAPEQPDTFPYKSHQATGWLQIILGLLAMILQIVDIVIVNEIRPKFLSTLDKDSNNDKIGWYYSSYGNIYYDGNYYQSSFAERQFYSSFAAAYVGAGLWTGPLFILVGAFGAALIPARKDSRMCLRNTYMVLCILNSVFVAPALVIVPAVELGMAAYYNGFGERNAAPWLLLIIGLTEVILTIVAASICCCCSNIPAPSTQVMTVVTYGQQVAYPAGVYPGGAQPAPYYPNPGGQPAPYNPPPAGHPTSNNPQANPNAPPVYTITPPPYNPQAAASEETFERLNIPKTQPKPEDNQIYDEAYSHTGNYITLK